MGAQIIIADEAATDRPLLKLHDIEAQIDVGLLCVEAASPDAVAKLRHVLAAPSVHAASWHVLWLSDTLPAPDLVPRVVPVRFGFRPSLSGERIHLATPPDARIEARTTRVRPGTQALAEGQALWEWLRPRLRLAP